MNICINYQNKLFWSSKIRLGAGLGLKPRTGLGSGLEGIEPKIVCLASLP